MILSNLFLHVTRSLINNDETPTIKVSLKEYEYEYADEVTVTTQIPCHWVSAYFEPFMREMLSNEGEDLWSELAPLFGSKAAERFVGLVEQSTHVCHNTIFSKGYMEVLSPICYGFQNWLEENYVRLMKQDAENAEIRAQVVA